MGSSRTPPSWPSRPGSSRPAPSGYAAQQGICQFLDVGCGLPTAPNTHETAQAIQPDARVGYADNDAQVLSHARNLLARSSGVLACAGDLNYPAEILYDWRIRRIPRLWPAGLPDPRHDHALPAPGQAGKITAELIAGIPAGRLRDHVRGRGDTELGEDMARACTAAPVYNQDRRPGALPAGAGHHRSPGITEAQAMARPGARIPGTAGGHAWAGPSAANHRQQPAEAERP